MDEPVRVSPDLQGTFPWMLRLLDKPVSTAFAENEGKFLINLLLQLLWIRFLDLIENPSELVVNPLFRLQKHTIESGKDFDLNDIGQISLRETFPTSHTMLLCHRRTTFISFSFIHLSVSINARFAKALRFSRPLILLAKGGNRPKLIFIG